MLTRFDLYEKILENINNGIRKPEHIAGEINDGRVFDELGDELINALSWIPLDKEMRVLEINGGCGVITGYLAIKSGTVDTIVFEEERLRINKALNAECGNICYLSDLSDTKYDVIIIYGLKRSNEADIRLLYDEYISYCDRHIKADGSIYIVFENRFGLENWKGKGLKEGRFTSLFNDDGKYISRKEMHRLLEKYGLNYFEYYPFPNHKFTRVIFSQERLPKRGELLRYYHDNFMCTDWELFNDSQVFDKLIDEGEFSFFSNSYIISATKEKAAGEQLIYAKYSTDRKREFGISTEIIRDNEDIYCRKRPLCEAAKKHIEKQHTIELKLKKRFDEKVAVVPSVLKEGAAISPFIEGTLLQSRLDELYAKGDFDGVLGIVEQYADVLYTGCTTVNFEPNDEFKRVFGDVALDGKYLISDITDMDFNFDNIIVADKWYVIDYEWSFDFPIPQKYILYRALRYWRDATHGRLVRSWSEWMKHFDISSHEEECFDKMERHFQSYASSRESLADIYFKYSKPIYTTDEIERRLSNEKVLSARIDNLNEVLKKDEAVLSGLMRYRSKRECAMSVVGNLDRLEVDEDTITVRGWAFIEGFNHNETDTYTLLIKKKDTKEIFTLGKLDKELREDVSRAHEEAVNIYKSGFIGIFKNEIGMRSDKGYSIGVQLHNDSLKTDRQIWF